MKLGEVGQVWCWAGMYHCVLLKYIAYDWREDQEIWSVLALEGDEAGTILKGYLHNKVATGDRTRWERVA